MASESTSLGGGHPIAGRIEEKLKSALKVEHFVSYPSTPETIDLSRWWSVSVPSMLTGW